MIQIHDFEEIYKKYYEQVYYYVLTLCGEKHLTEEITQETFFKVLKKIDSFRGECKLEVWICQIAKNTYYNYCRKKKISLQSEDDQIAASDDIEKEMLDKDMAKQIHQILHRLEEPYREVFWMRTFGELSFREIGSLHHKSEGWARVTYYRAKLKIKEELK